VFYKNGYLYILSLLRGDVRLAALVNRLLLIGYYLLNLGYATVMLGTWRTIHSLPDLCASVAGMSGRIMITLGLIHCLNMAVIWILSRKHSFNHHKS
jgi:hypothetical protein